MADILAYVTTLMGSMFGTTGYIASVVTFITSNAYCMIGLSLMLAGAAVSFLSKIIRNS